MVDSEGFFFQLPVQYGKSDILIGYYTEKIAFHDHPISGDDWWFSTDLRAAVADT